MTREIRSQTEYERVLARIQQLRTSPATIAEACELKQLLGAADGWKRRSSRRAMGQLGTEALALQTGPGLALEMSRRFPRRDWVADLADAVGKDRNYVERHLQHDVMPPEELQAAATRLIEGKSSSSHTAAEPGLPAP